MSFLKYHQAYLGAFFLFISVLCFGIGGFYANESRSFLTQGERTEGVVIEMDRKRGSSKSGTGIRYVYAPIFEFKDRANKAHVVRSSSWSDPPAFTQGEKVEVLYRSQTPDDAVINSFSQLWLIPTITGSIGLVMAIVGIFCIVLFLKKRELEQWLRQNGQRIPTDIQGSELNRQIKVNGRSPYRLVTTWKDPATQTVYTFKSDSLWEDPMNKLQGRKTVDVLIKPGDPTKYWMDLSVLGYNV